MIKWFKRNQNSEPNLDTEEHQDHAESSMESRLEEPQELTVKEPSPKEGIFARF
ncbi:signal recognition particle-docking protein FtsY, partial [Escherichia coli]|nr:signal recognition particle-docking protein FtsY [Escherichia coli]